GSRNAVFRKRVVLVFVFEVVRQSDARDFSRLGGNAEKDEVAALVWQKLLAFFLTRLFQCSAEHLDGLPRIGVEVSKLIQNPRRHISGLLRVQSVSFNAARLPDSRKPVRGRQARYPVQLVKVNFFPLCVRCFGPDTHFAHTGYVGVVGADPKWGLERGKSEGANAIDFRLLFPNSLSDRSHVFFPLFDFRSLRTFWKRCISCDGPSAVSTCFSAF
ncbi:MAG TPA: hypothetical protein VI874_04820, partial [Candidatus Norongarragalinales archaeon]|nr:hypothetical protein [Candidatus Norongarragalinales archaeon]